MLLGKRPRPPIKRNMSITEFTIDLNNVEVTQPTVPSFDPREVIRDLQIPAAVMGPPPPLALPLSGGGGGGSGGVISDGFDPRLLSTISPRNMMNSSSPRNRRHSGDFSQQPSNFLRACGLCNRRLAPGRDIYMYRGDTAFCSLECRQQQMSQDERKEKFSSSSSSSYSASKSNLDHPSSSTVESDQAGSNQSGTTVAAA